MKGFIQFIRTKIFLKHILIASIAALALLWLAFELAGVYTKHGDIVKVPDFVGKSIKSLDSFIVNKEIRYEIIDSVYAPKEAPGVVVRQEPEKESEVKHNRTIYLYVTSVLPPQITMPKLVDRSLRQATSMIESYGLKMGKTRFVTDPCSNCILGQFYKGKEIKPGTMLQKGSVIDLQVGKGSGSEEQVLVPNLIGLNFCDAEQKINSSSLHLGKIVFDKQTDDSCSAYVYKQLPISNPNNLLPVGSGVDLYLTSDKSKAKLLNGNSNSNEED